MSVLLREAIGGSIRRARTERNRTLRDVSHSARVSLGYLSEIERGRKEPSSELLAAICDALSLSLPDLLDEVADSMRPRTLRPRRTGSVTVLDPALRTAVEEALEQAQDAPDELDDGASTEAVPGETVPVGGSGDDADGADDQEGPSARLAPEVVEELPDDDEDLDGTEVGDAPLEAPGHDGDPADAPVVLVGRATLASLPTPLAPVGTTLTSTLTTVRVAA